MHRFSTLFTLGKAAPAYLAAMQALVGDLTPRRPGDRGNRTDRAAPC
jgi:hypothetical protein